MRRMTMLLAAVVGWAIVGSLVAVAQTSTPPGPAAQSGTKATTASSPAAAPQTPRQAILEILKSPDKATLEKHLPDAAKGLVEKSPWGQQMFAGFAGISNSNVQRRGEGMVADIRCVVARAARARYRRKAKVVVDAGDTGNVNGCGVEESLPTRNGRARVSVR